MIVLSSLCLLDLLVRTSVAAPIKPTGWSSSSYQAEADGFNYNPPNLGDGRASTYFVEGDDGSGLGSWVQADLGAEKTINTVTIYAGCWYTSSYWARYNRPKVVLLEFSDGSTQEATLTDEYKPQVIPLSSAKKTSFVKIKVKQVYTGNTFNDTAISEVIVSDSAPNSWTPVSAFKASTTLPEDGDASYEASNTSDGVLDTMWCEGDSKGDGTGQWVEWTFSGQMPVSKVVLRNGTATSFSLFMKSNRATGATLMFSDGTTEAITVKDTVSEQSIAFPSHTTGKVRLTVNTVKKGTEYNDLCLSEVYFYP